LRVLETGEFLRVGDEEMCKVDVRIITATNADLSGKVAENKFREDLFYRLDVASLNIPPLRERQEDIDLFVEFFLEIESKAKQLPLKQLTPEALELFRKHEWPGNIRELSNTVAQALLLSKGDLIEIEDLPDRIRRGCETVTAKSAEQQTAETVENPGFSSLPEIGDTLKALLDQFENTLFKAVTFRKGFDFELFNREIGRWRDNLLATLIERAVEDTYGNQAKAAELLGITPRALRYHQQKTRKKENANQD
jgi:two-component system, NtrC family, response regulator